MATLDELIKRLNEFPEKVQKTALDIYKYETPVGNTGGLKASVKVVGASAEHTDVGATASYAELAKEGGHGGLFPDYFGNRASVHYPQNTDWSTPRFNANGRRKWARVRNTRPNPYDERAASALRQVNWNDVFWNDYEERV